MRKIFKLLTSKFFLVAILLLLELAIVPATLIWLSMQFPTVGTYVSAAFLIIDIVLVLYVINSEMNAEYKIAWIVPILLIPPIGACLYLIFRRKKNPRRKLKKHLMHDLPEIVKMYERQTDADVRFLQIGAFAQQCAELVRKESAMPATDCYEYKYFSSGEEYGAQLEKELAAAKKYIFLEYFIISEGKFWDRVHKILLEKVAKGVDVRIIYDDIGSLLGIPHNFAARMEKEGIRCLCFNRFRPVLDVAQNNRTHRKIAVIDGVTAFTGGINIADEYTNEIELHGHWKDTGVMVRGRAAQNFTAMFLQLWELKNADDNRTEKGYDKFLSPCDEGKYACLPFADSPFQGGKNICEALYLKIIYNAKKYVYINTPYLILDDEMKRALITAARSGVDVRITIPRIPDKKYVYAVTKAFYTQLIKEGIRIYRYTPGFIHAKSIVSDGNVCIIGSSNMDFRSFYLHCECNIMFFDKEVADDLYEDYLHVCAESELMTESGTKDTLFRKIYRSVLRFFAPLM